MNNINAILLSLTLVAGTLLGGCRDNDDRRHYRVVPANASILLAARLETLKQKSGIATRIAPLLEQEAGDPIAKKALEILRDGKASGLDLEKEVLLFSVGYGHLVGAVALMQDRARFTRCLDAIVGSGERVEITKKEGYYRAIISNQLLLVFNNDILLCLPDNGDDTWNEATRLLSQKKEESILSNEKFTGALDAGDDITLYFNMQPLAETGSVGALALFTGIDVSKITLTTGISFRDGLIRATTRHLPLDPALAGQQASASRPLTLAHLDYLPATTSLLVIANVNGEAYYKFLEKSLALAGNFPGLNDQLPPDALLDFADFVKAIDGEITLGIAPAPAGVLLPSILFRAGVKNDRPSRVLNTYLTPRHLPVINATTETSPGHYRVDAMYSLVSLYHGIDNGQLYFTTDKNLLEKSTDSYKNSPLARRIPAATKGYFLVDLPAVTRALPRDRIDESLVNALSRLRYIEGYSVNDTTTVFQLEFTDKSENALAIIVNALYNYLGIFN